MWGVGFLLYAGWFLLINPLRREVLPFLLSPDGILTVWVDGSWARFAPWDHLPVVAGALLIVGVCGATGLLLLDGLGLGTCLTRWERIIFGTAIGLNAWSLGTLTAGLAGLLRERWLFALAALGIVGLTVWRWGWSRSPKVPVMSDTGQPARATSEAPSDWLIKLCLGASILFGLLIVWGGTQPPTYFDVREYHLQVPKEWYQAGRVTFLPHNVYGNMPLGAEMHAILGMLLVTGERDWWWGSLIGKTVIAIMAPLGAMAVYAWGRRFLTPAAGAAACLIFLSTPWIAHVSMNGMIDGCSALFMLLALYATQLRQATTGRDTGLIALAGFMAGSAVACKYPAVLFLAVPLGAWIGWGQFRRFDGRAAAIYSVAVLAGCGLWLGKNWILAGNPTYPLLDRWFDGRSWTDEQDARWTKAHGPPREGAAPYTVGQALGGARVLLLNSDSLSPVLWPFAIMACFMPAVRRRLALFAAFIAWTVVVWWFLTHRVDRFLVPLLPLVAAAAGAGVAWQSAGAWRGVAVIALIAGTLFNFVFDALVVSDNRFLVSLQSLQRDLHPAHLYLNEHARPGYRALMVGEAQVWDIAVPVLYNTCFDDCELERLTKGRTRTERFEAFRDLRISHIYVSWYELDRYRSPGNYGYSDYPTRDLIRGELVREQRLLRPVPLDLNEESGQLFEVVGWQDWE
ncbi:MAG: ArnT family glycosyltransferase [Pirellulaceae bacterium]